MLKMYTFYDKVAERYSVFDMAPTDAVAQRNFREWIQKFASRHAEDLSLYCCGDFDDISGELTPNKYFVEKGALIDDK